MKYQVIFMFCLIAKISFSQGKVKIKDADLDSLELKFHVLEYTDGKCSVKSINEDEGITIGDIVQIQFIAHMKDGTTITSPLDKKDKTGLKVSQFEITVEGEKLYYSPLLSLRPRASFILSGSFNKFLDRETGDFFAEITVQRIGSEKVYSRKIKVKRSEKGESYTTIFAGYNLKIEVSIDSTLDPSLVIKTYLLDADNKLWTWRIDPDRDFITVASRGDGGSYFSDNTSQPHGKPGGDGQDGGDITIIFKGKAKDYEKRIKLDASGGRGGKGSSGYLSTARDGRDGRDGTVDVIYED